MLDEDSQAQLLVKLLTTAGHDVFRVNQAKLAGSSDLAILDYARAQDRIVLTHNCDDFEELHLSDSIHPGILAVYRSANLLKNMSFKDIVRAISNLEVVQIPLAGQFIPLNQWNY